MNTKFLNSAWRVLLALVFSLSLAGISAQEARAATYTVSNLNDSGSGSLRDAITSANGHLGADTITFNLSGKIMLGSSLPAISEDLTITGSGQNIIISGMGICRVLYVNASTIVTISDLTISDGYTGSSTGAGIYNAGSLTVRDVTFSGNGAGLHGGAIYSHFGTLVVLNSTFAENSVGALYRGGAIYAINGILTVANSTFAGNVADKGGGIFNDFGTTRVTNSTFSGNTGTTHGGAIYSTGGSLYLKNNILANSTAPDDCYSETVLSSDIHNLIEVNWGCGTPVSSADPKLVPLADNGGPTRTFALLPGSPAFDAGDDVTCTAAPVYDLDQRGVSRPHSAHCDIGSFEMDKGTLTARSVDTYDGWILESGENTSVGGTLDSTSTTFRLGDEAGDRQYRAILSFNTSALPNTAVITRVILKLRKQGLMGTDPFTILGGLKADIHKSYFGTGLGLVVGDFQATASLANVSTFKSTPKNNWYFAVIGSAGYSYISLNGTTQFRLRFSTDDNNDNGADYMRFFSGDYATAAARPALVVEFSIP